MGTSKSRPDQVTTIRTYAELRNYTRAFAEGHFGLLLLCGAQGLGKSQSLRQAVGTNVCWIDGNASAFGIYCAAYQHRDQPLVLDDVDGLYKERQGVRLLKTLCQTDPVKRLSWQTASGVLEKQGVPREFTTNSRVAVIANHWHSRNADVAALEDRGHLLNFVPDALEVHRQAATWFWDQDVFDFIATHLHVIKEPSLRIYHRAAELKSAGLPWQEGVLSRCLAGPALAVALLKNDPDYQTQAERVQAFIDAGHGSRATWFNHARKLKSLWPVPAIALTTDVNPYAPAPEIDLVDLLRQRHGQIGNG